ncbi:MAG: Fic family protein [Candidatus Babeliales bacterium]
MKFLPHYQITPEIAQNLMRIEAVREKVVHLSLTSTVLSSLRESARLYTTHYSTMIEGNRLSLDQIEQVLKHEGHFPGRERDEREVLGYYAALDQVEKWAIQGISITERIIQTIHALVVADGKIKTKPTPYRTGQNVIRDGISKTIIYLPPEADDVPSLMRAMIAWIKDTITLPVPLVAAIVHYQLVTIHPYYDGNGRTARLLTTLILHLGGYDLKGLYALEEYYARNLGNYYDALSIGPSHNYYFGRAEADITPWINYFIEGMAVSFENVSKRMDEATVRGLPDQYNLIRSLDQKQRHVLALFEEHVAITAKQVGALFGLQPRTSSALCKKWVDTGFLEIVDFSNKGRKYALAKRYQELMMVVK